MPAKNGSTSAPQAQVNSTAASMKRVAPPKPNATTAPKKAGRKKSAAAAPTEILFKDKPNPALSPAPPFIWIDHPQQDERLYASHYSIRLGVGGAIEVEISIDRSPWRPCRFDSGYWWFDWHDIPVGKHVLAARLKTSGGQWYRTPPRNVER